MLTNKAYFLIETAIGKSRDVSLALQSFDWVEYVERVAGPYDVVGVAKAGMLEEIAELINDEVRAIDGIIRVVVCPISTMLETGVPAQFAVVG